MGLTNQTSSFFTVETVNPLGLKTELDLSHNVLDFEFNEELGQIASGQIRFIDDNQEYSRTLRQGKLLSISFGYKDFDTSLASILKRNPTEFVGPISRQKITAMVLNPQGSGDQAGVPTFNCRFMCYHNAFLGRPITTTFETGTKATVILEMMTRAGVITPSIIFPRGVEPVTPKNPILCTNKTPFAFLTEKANEWGAKLLLTYNPAGLLQGFFHSPDALTTGGMTKGTTGAAGVIALMEWKEGARNVLSYSWSINTSEGGAGDHVTAYLNPTTGTISFQRSPASGEVATDYVLNMAAIKSVLKAKKAEGGAKVVIQEVATIQGLALDITSFNTLVKQGIYVPASSPTAPQGGGYEIQMETLGNTNYTAGTPIALGLGFPDFFWQSKSVFYMHSVGHKISRSGYKTSIKIKDVYSAFAGALLAGVNRQVAS